MANLLKQYREAFPEFREMKDDELIDALWNKYGGEDSKTDKADFALEIKGRGPKISGFKAGIESLKSSTETGIGRLLYAAGAEETGKEMQRSAEERMQDTAERYQPAVSSYKDVTGPVSAGQYLYEGISQSLPSMGAMGAGAAAGALAGSFIPVVGTGAGAVIGAGLSMLPSYIGGNIQAQMEEGKKFEETNLPAATAAAAGQTAADVIAGRLLLRAFPGLGAPGGPSRLLNSAKRGIEGGLAEAPTEAVQDALEIMQANPEKFFEFGPEVQDRIINAAILGGGTGFLLGGAGGALSRPNRKAPEGEPEGEPAAGAEPPPNLAKKVGVEPPPEGEPGGTEPGGAEPPEGEPGAAGTEPVTAGTEPVSGVEPVAGVEPPPTVQGPEPAAAPPQPLAPAPKPAPAPAPEPVKGPEIFALQTPPSLPKKMQLGKWNYNYGQQGSFTLNFSSDLEKALFQISKKNPKATDLMYRDWLKQQGLTDNQIDTFGTEFRQQLTSLVGQKVKGGQTTGIIDVPRYNPGSFGLGTTVTPAPAPSTPPAAPAPTGKAPATPAAPATPPAPEPEPTPFGAGAEPGTTPGAIPFPEQETRRKTSNVSLGPGVSGYQFQTQAPGQATSLITMSTDDHNRFEKIIPGAVDLLREIHARMFPGMKMNLRVGGGTAGPRGSSTPLSRKEFLLEINPEVLKKEFGSGPDRQTKMLHTMFHELSHAIEQVYLLDAPPAVLETIIKQYVRSRNPSAMNRAAVVFALKNHKDASDPKFLQNMMSHFGISAETYKKFLSSKSTQVSVPVYIAAGDGSYEIREDYFRSFTEWVAEKGAEWLTKEAKGLVPKTTFQKFQKAILDRLRKLYTTIAKSLGLPVKKGAFEQFMEDNYGKRAEVSAILDVVKGKDVIDYKNVGDFPQQGKPSYKAIKAFKPGSKVETEPGPTPTQKAFSMEEKAAPEQQAAPSDIESIRKKIFAAAPDARGGFRKFVDKVQELYKEGGWKALSDAFVREAQDKYVYLKRLDDRFVAAMKAAGNTVAAGFDGRMALAARLSSYASMLDRENTLAKLNTLLLHGGVPVYVVKDPNNPLDGIIKIEGKGGGLTFLKDLQKSGKLMNWAEYAVAKRVLGSYQNKNLEFQITPQEAQAIVDLYGQDPEIVNAYNQYQEFNKSVIKLAVDSGRLSEKDAENLLEYMDYFPFYRFVGEDGRYNGPVNAKSLLSPSKIMQSKGGTELIQGDPVDMILKNVQFWLGASQKNISARKIYTMSQALGEGRQLSFSKAEQEAMLDEMFGGDAKAMRAYMQREKMLRPGEIEGTYFVDGQERRIALSNPDVAEALLATDAPLPDIFKGIFGTFTTGYRELVTRSPEYILSNVIRDSVSQWVTSGVSFNPLRAIRNVYDFMRQRENNEKVLALMQYGVIGGYKSVPELDDATKLMNPNFNPTKGGIYVPKNGKVLTDIIAKAWNTLGDFSDASDAASRMEIFDKVYKETGDEYEAAFRAQEAMNYRKQGRNALLKYLTVMVPFVNGRIQGLDVTLRAFGPKAIAYTGIKGAYLFGTAMALQAMFGDDEEYKQLPEYVRYGSLPIPLKVLGLGDSGFLAVPKPFEMGFVFQTIPEVIYQAMLGNVETRNIARLVGEQLASTFGLSLTPQVLSPIVETFIQNRSNLTGLPIVTEAMKNLPRELQYTSATSDIVKDVGSVTGLSPVQLEALIKGYTGQIGTSLFGIIDGMYRATTGRGVDKDWTQYPVVQKFLKTEQNTNPQGVADVYRLSAEIQGLTTAINTFIAQGSADKALDLIEKNEGLLGMKQTISGLRTNLNMLSRQERMIANSDQISQDDKEEQIKALREARRTIGRAMTESIKYTEK